MKEDEFISYFNIRLLNIAKTSFSIGEKMPEEKLIRKIIRLTPKKFDMKVVTIKEAKDLSGIKVDELIGSLQTFEIAINDRLKKE